MTNDTKKSQQEETDDFGLPQDEFKPIRSETSRWLMVSAAIGILAFSIGVGIVYWFLYRVPVHRSSSTGTIHPANQGLEKKSTKLDELTEKDTVNQSAIKNNPQTERYQASKILEGDKKVKSFSKTQVVSRKKTGTITNVRAPSNSYYVIVGSFIDDDLALDFANKLAEKGINTTLIIPPQGQYFYRVAVEQKNTLHDAHTKATTLPSEYGHDVWIMKY